MSSGRPKRQQQDRDRFILSIRGDLAKAVRDLAEQERRTINSQVELLIERGLQDWPRMEPVVSVVAA